MRIETEIEALTVGSLRALLAQAERAGAGNDAAVSFSRRRSGGGHVARVEFEPGPRLVDGARIADLARIAESESRGAMVDDGVGLTHPSDG